MYHLSWTASEGGFARRKCFSRTEPHTRSLLRPPSFPDILLLIIPAGLSQSFSSFFFSPAAQAILKSFFFYFFYFSKW
jgi:hypothetical protein